MTLEQDLAKTPQRVAWAKRKPILLERRNCWRVRRARRAALLVDACAYYRVLHAVLERTERSALILGWDFDPSIALEPGGTDTAARPLREYLADLVERRPALHVRILVWRNSIVYGDRYHLPPPLDPRWPRHPRLTFRYAHDHPFLGAHHEKVVVADDAIAFCGGMDLTGCRWDDRAHKPDNGLRVDGRGHRYEAKHDVQLAVDGEAARACGQLARRRWWEATREHLAPLPRGLDPWPDALEAAVQDIDVGIARTHPRRGVREAEALILDALGAARERIYVESQYLTSWRVGEQLARILQRRRGPEIVCLVRKRCDGVIQRFAMGSNRDRLLRRLRKADVHGRFHAFHPVALDDEGHEHEINVHSKLICVDDRLLRVGSSNLNNRSMGFDTECDLALEARTEEQRAALRRVPEALLAEHLGREPEDVAGALAETGSLATAIERLGGHPRRRLVPFVVSPEGRCLPIPGTGIVDPDGPIVR